MDFTSPGTVVLTWLGKLFSGSAFPGFAGGPVRVRRVVSSEDIAVTSSLGFSET